MSVLAVIFAAAALPTPLSEGAWACGSESDGPIQVVVSYDTVVDPDDGKAISPKRGRVDLGQDQQYGTFEVEGLDRVWRFGFDNESQTFNYMIMLSPRGMARYYNFSNAEPGESKKPDYLLHCTELPTQAG